MGVAEAKATILANKTALGIEFGSTRIKAVLVDDKNQPNAPTDSSSMSYFAFTSLAIS